LKPVELERAFVKLQYHLASPAGARLKLALVSHFLGQCREFSVPQVIESYYLQLLPHLETLVSDDNLSYFPPDFLQKLLVHLNTLKKACETAVNHGRIEHIRQTIRRNLALLYLCLGAYQEAGEYLGKPTPSPSLAEALQEAIEGRDTWPERLPSLRSVFARYGLNQECLDILQNRLAPPDETKLLNVLLVEQNGVDHQHFALGTIQPLSVRLHELDRDRDLLLFNFRENQFDDLMYQQSREAWEYAREVLSGNFLSRGIGSHYQVEYAFPRNEYFYTGDSLGAGLGLLNIAALSEITLNSTRYALKSDFAITGRLDRWGRILPISKISLEKKLEAFFFSHFAKLVLPSDNRVDAESFLSGLRERFPGRNYEITYARNIKELLNNDKLVTKHETAFTPIKYLRRYRQYVIGATSIILLFLLLLATLPSSPVLGRKNTNPVAWNFVGNYVNIINKAGDILWSYKINTIKKDQDYIKNNIRVYIDDINNDGNNEVLIGNSFKGYPGCGILTCFSKEGEILWQYNNHQKTIWGDNTYSSEYVLAISTLRTVDLNGDNYKEILAVFLNIPWFPAKLMIFDQSGKVISCFWNAGYIYDIKFLDVDNDGILDIILAATNNEYNQPTLIILDYRDCSGLSPQNDNRYILKDAPKAKVKYYLRFPNANFLLAEANRGTCRYLTIQDNHVLVSTSIGRLPEGSLYTFNKNFEVIDISLKDGFLFYYYNKFQRSFYSDYDKDDVIKLLSKIKYWDGDKWVDYPTKTKYWQKTDN